MKQRIYLLIILTIMLLISGCLDTETTEAFNELKEIHIANDISKPYGEIYIRASQDWGGKPNYIVVDGEVEIQNADSHVIIKVEDGAGRMEFDTWYDDENGSYINDNLLFSRTFYGIKFNGSEKWYDMILSNELPEYPTFDKELSINLNVGGVVKVGNFNNMVGVPQEVQNIDLFKTNSFIIPIAVTGNYGRIKNPVLSFVNDWSEPFERGEFGSATLELISGLDMNAPRDITEIVKSGMVGDVPLWQEIDGNGDRWINAGSYARYRLTFHDIDYRHLTKGDIKRVFLDDLDGYRKGDIFKSTKADAVQVATIYCSVDFTTEYDDIIITDETITFVKDDKVVIIDNRA